jgi:hypothetical protein
MDETAGTLSPRPPQIRSGFKSPPLSLDLRKPRGIPVTDDIHIRRTSAKSPVSSQSRLSRPFLESKTTK